MAKARVVQPEPVVTLMRIADVGRVMVIGAIIGLAAVALYFVLSKYVFTPILCGQFAGGDRCDSTLQFANALALIFAGVAGLFALVRQRVFRPLLVVLLSTIALWQVIPAAVSLNGWLLAVFMAVLFALAYGLFTWIVQIRSFAVAAIISVVLVVATWWLLVS